MAESKTNTLPEESIGHAPYYRTASPLGDQIEQARLSTKHIPKVLVMGSHDSLRSSRTQLSDEEYRLDHVLKANLDITPLDHGNSHDRSMLASTKITDRHGGKGIVGTIRIDENMPQTLACAPAEVMHHQVKVYLQEHADRCADRLLELFPHETVMEMAANKHAPATDVHDYVIGKLQGASADYVERAIGEQYGVVVLNKAKATRAAE